MKPATPTYQMTPTMALNYLFFVLAFAVMVARGFLYLGHMPLVHLACLAGKMALVPIAAILMLRTPGKPSAIDLGMILYGLSMYVACITNHTQILTITLHVLDVFVLWALCRWFFNRQSLFPLKAITMILFVFIVLNFLLVLWRPAGIWQYGTNGKMYYLLGGNYNNMGKAMLIAILSNALLLAMLPKQDTRSRMIFRVTLPLLILISIGTLVYMGSMTSLAGTLLLCGFLVLAILPGRGLRATAMVLFIFVYFALQSWAVFRDMETPFPRVEYVVERVMKKDMTFSLRTHVWERTKRLIERKPVLGYGEHDDLWYQTELEGLTTHNLVLHILLKGGWVALSCFIILILATHGGLLRSRTRTPDNVPFMLLAGLWVYLFMMIFEVYPFYSLSFILIYASHLTSINVQDLKISRFQDSTLN